MVFRKINYIERHNTISVRMNDAFVVGKYFLYETGMLSSRLFLR